jgi:hypothetical protein
VYNWRGGIKEERDRGERERERERKNILHVCLSPIESFAVVSQLFVC